MQNTPQMKVGSVLGLGIEGFHRIAYTQWGEASAKRTLMCVHGLTRNARDFDRIGESLAPRFRVVCPDVAGRGQSDWLRDPSHYHYLQYNADMNAVIARLDVDELDWLGTSMGGIIGMMLASLPGTPIRRLILNDVGPHLPREGLKRLADYLGHELPVFVDLDDVVDHFREIYAPFGPMTDDDWQHMAEHSVNYSDNDNGYVLKHDPSISYWFKNGVIIDVSLWEYWDKLRCPVLVIRGEKSDFLSPATVEEMRRRGPDVTVIEVPGVGHTPTLNNEEHIRLIERWLVETA
jgi:pimeloyl-ACP methyl ester carboxylesterase